MYKSNNQKNNKEELQKMSGDLNATHAKMIQDQEIKNLSIKIKDIFEPFESLSRSPQSLEHVRSVYENMEKEFPNLLKETNLLKEGVLKVAHLKLIPFDERYNFAYSKVPSVRGSIPELCKAAEKQDKQIFLRNEKALDNTSIINAYVHEASLFKVGAVYSAYKQACLNQRVVEMLIVLRVSDLPDQFKYIETEETLEEATLLEIGEQAYNQAIEDDDLDAVQRFNQACNKLIKLNGGLKKQPEAVEEDIQFPDIPDTGPVACSNEDHPLSKQAHFNFTGNELVTLQFLIPPHKKESIVIPEVGGLELDKFMRACLSKQMQLKDTKDDELKKRNHYQKFLHDLFELLQNAQRSMQEHIQGKTFASEHGYTGWSSIPENLYTEITKIFQKQKKQQVIIEDCKLAGPELTEKFFDRAFKLLKNSLEQKRSEMQVAEKKAKKQSNLFNHSPLRHHQEKVQTIEENYTKLIKEMQSFQKITLKIGAEHIKIFSGNNDLKSSSSYCFPKHAQKDVEAIIAETLTASISSNTMARR